MLLRDASPDEGKARRSFQSPGILHLETMHPLLILLGVVLLTIARASTPEEAAAAGIIILDDGNFGELP